MILFLHADQTMEGAQLPNRSFVENGVVNDIVYISYNIDQGNV